MPANEPRRGAAPLGKGVGQVNTLLRCNMGGKAAASTVIPAKAGTSGQEVSAGLHEVPAFAGMTRLSPSPYPQ
ncbi:MAG: hypothetical protein QOG72_1126 [Sphingomonadales bacterium]|jgi:hypothetical protein|nr:hypothetical protein [Sphingomonadales bacterium]